jgi:hypothetical protein
MLLYFYARPLGMRTAQLYECKLGNYRNLDFLLFSRVISSGIIVVFCSTLSEFENFLLCEWILINVTTCQNQTSSEF